MSQFKRNILANFTGQGWSMLLNLVVVPIYIRLMGIEAFGLVGIFAILQTALILLDMGLSPTMNREMARYSTHPEKSQEARDLVRTLEVGYWGLAVLIAVGVMALAPLIARDWVRANQLSPQTIQQAVMIMGVVAACQWPLSFYSGGLQGLQKQVLLNVINGITGTVRAGGTVLVLWWLSPTITAFFAWQIFTSALQTGLITFFFWRSLPTASRPPRFRPELLRIIWRFAGGMSAITVVTLVLTQMDKVILSRLLPLEMFGYYTLAWLMANGLSVLVGPVFIAVFPQFSKLVESGDEEGLKRLYHRGCQLMSVVILPFAVVVILFSHKILLLWTRNTVTADNTYRIASLLVMGTALNGLINLPYALQLAHGWTKLTFYTNLVALLILTPLLLVLTSAFGVVGAAAVWVILNGGYVLILPHIIHRRLLKGEQWRWYLEDVSLPLVAAVSVILLGRLIIRESISDLALVASLGGVWGTATLAAAMATPHLRDWLKIRLGEWRAVRHGG